MSQVSNGLTAVGLDVTIERFFPTILWGKRPPSAESIYGFDVGEVAEWLKAAVLKTVMDREVHLGFESQPLRKLAKVLPHFLDIYYCMRDPAHHKKKLEMAGEISTSPPGFVLGTNRPQWDYAWLLRKAWHKL